MNRRIAIAPLAHADIERYFIFIALDSEEAATAFQEAVQRTIAFIAENPGTGSARYLHFKRLVGVRSVAVRGFPNHLVFYRQPTKSSVRIIRVLHGAMDLPRVLKRKP